MKIDVAFTPSAASDLDLSNTVCIVLDVFRATTSIITAISNGCRTIIPVPSIEDARTTASSLGSVLFAGERQSIRIEGFQFGNSPFEFSPEKVQGQTIVMTTTNGTIAIKAAEGAYRVVIGSFINAEAVCLHAAQYKKDILILCAGTDRLFSLEDALCAGLFVKLLSEASQTGVTLTDSAYGASLMYNSLQQPLAAILSSSRNGKRLYDLGCLQDVEYCVRTNIINVVPEYKEGKITAAPLSH